MWRILRQRDRDDISHAFGEHEVYRRSAFHSRREMMGIAGDTHCALAGHQKLGELRVTLMKFYVVCGDLLDDSHGLFFAIVLVLQTDEKLHIPRFGDQPAFPSRIDEVFKLFGLFVFFIRVVFHAATMNWRSVAT